MLARSLRSRHNDQDAKPNAAVRDILNQIVAYPPTQQLSNEEQDYVWKYRFYLSTQKKALAKFLKCVNWNQLNEVQQAKYMIQIWQPMDVEGYLLVDFYTTAKIQPFRCFGTTKSYIFKPFCSKICN